MIPQLLVQKIKSVLEVAPAFDDTYAATLAEAFARLTHETNVRLDQCRDLIGRQMFSEALAISECVPPLPDLCDQLTFGDLAAWIELCTFCRWPQPEAVPSDPVALDLLKKAYASNKILEPLQRLFRTSVRMAMTRETLQLIARLEKADPKNPNWRANRAEFEKKRLAEIRAEFEAFRTAPEEPVLRTLLGEISAMTCCSDDALGQQLATLCDRLEVERLNAAAVRLVDRLSQAYSALNVEDGRRHFSRLRQLLDTGKVTESGSMRLQREDAAVWLAGEDRKDQAKADFLAATAEVRALVDSLAEEGVEESLSRLEGLGRQDESAELAEKARSLIARNARRLRLRRAAMVAISAASALAVSACLLAFIHRQRLERLVAETVNELRLALDAEDAERFSERLAELEREQPIVFGDARIRSEAARLQELRTNVGVREARFRESLRALGEAQALTDRDQTLVCERLLDSARLLAITPSQKQRLATVEKEWSDFREQRRKKDNAALEQLCETLSTGLGELETMMSKGLLREALDAHEDLDVKSDEKERLSYANAAEQLSRFTRLNNALQKVRSALNAREERFRMIENAATITDYLAALGGYSQAFSGDELARAFKRILACAQQYRRFDQSLPDHVWTDHLRNSAEAERLGKAITEILQTPGYSELWSVKAKNIATARDQQFFFPNEPRAVIGDTGLHPGDRAKLYQEVYYKEMGAYRFEKRVLNLEIKEAPQPYKACAYLTNSLGRLTLILNNPLLSKHHAVIQTIQAVATDTTLPSRLRIALIDVFSGSLPNRNAFRKNLPPVAPDFFERMVYQRKAVEEGENVLLKEFAANIALNDKETLADSLLVWANTRDVRFVGCVGRDQKPDLRATKRDGIREVWTMDTTGTTGKPVVAFEKRGDDWEVVSGTLPETFLPLFAPLDGQLARERLELIRKGGYQDPIKLPALWPQNLQQ
jgi:hypothetical protein